MYRKIKLLYILCLIYIPSIHIIKDIYTKSNFLYIKMIDKNKAYNTLPKIPPKKELLETTKVLKALTAAHRELSALKGEARGLTNPNILFETLPLQEAKSSSKIENIITTTDKLYEALSLSQTEQINPATKEVLNYREAVQQGLELLKDYQNLVTTRMFEKICSTIKASNMKVRHTPTALINEKTNGIIYTPPEGENLLRELLKNIEEFINEKPKEEDLDPLLKMAILHYQFEAIHPFADGNGRTGRILNILFLIQQKLLDEPILYLSSYINDHRTDYYKKLSAVTYQSHWEDWVLYMIEAIRVSARNTRKKVERLGELFNKQYKHIKDLKINKAYELTELIFIRPYCFIDVFVKEGLGQRITATRHLKMLSKHGILKEEKKKKRLMYIHQELLELMREDDE